MMDVMSWKRVLPWITNLLSHTTPNYCVSMNVISMSKSSARSKAIKYMYKYVYKGHDVCVMELELAEGQTRAAAEEALRKNEPKYFQHCRQVASFFQSLINQSLTSHTYILALLYTCSTVVLHQLLMTKQYKNIRNTKYRIYSLK